MKHSMIKPHIYYRDGYWICTAIGGHGEGGNPRAAYEAFKQNAAIRACLNPRNK